MVNKRTKARTPPSQGCEMSVAEIRELLDLRQWKQRDLARELELTEGAVTRWLSGEHTPRGPARQRLRQLLEDARSRPALVG